MLYVYIVKYYSALKKKEGPPFATTRMNLECIILREITQRETNTVSSHLYVKSKKVELTEAENRIVVVKGWGMGETGRYWSKATNLQL